MLPEAPTGAIRQLAALALHGELSTYANQIQRLGGCERPVRMEGHRLDVDASTGEIVREIVDRDLPAGQLLIRCNNRRATRCAACAEVYRKDTYHLVTAGLSGGKGIGPAVAEHPRVFATFTAPSFGPVHNRPGGGRCRCGRLHPDGDPVLGTPLNPDRYDYRSAERPYQVVSEFCDRAADPCEGQAPAHPGVPPWLRSQDLQAFAGAGPVTVRPIRIETLFAASKSGRRLSDHDGYLVRYRLSWDPAVAVSPRPPVEVRPQLRSGLGVKVTWRR